MNLDTRNQIASIERMPSAFADRYVRKSVAYHRYQPRLSAGQAEIQKFQTSFAPSPQFGDRGPPLPPEGGARRAAHAEGWLREPDRLQ